MPQIHHHAAIRAHSMARFKDCKARNGGHEKGKIMRTLMFGIIMYGLMYTFAMLPMVVIVILTWIVYGIKISLKYLGVI